MSPVPAFGHRTFMQIGAKETTYGTFLAPSGTYKYRLDVLSWSLTPQIGIVRDKSYTGVASQVSRTAAYQGPIYYKGTITVKCQYEGLKEILRGVFGTYTSDSSLTTLDEKFTEGLTLNSYSVEIGWGDFPAGKVLRILGLKFIGMTIKGTASTGDDGMLTVDLQVVARDIDTNSGAGYNATGSINYPAQFPVFFHQAVLVDDGTNDLQTQLRVTNFEVTFEGAHVEDRLYLSSLLIDEPIRDDAVVGRFKLTQELNSQSPWQVSRLFSLGSPRLIFQNPTNLTILNVSAVCNVSGPGVFTITRAAGSFITDGVKVGHYVATTTVFPPGTYVSNVVALTVTVVNNSGGSIAALVNGTISFTTNRELELRMGSANLVDYPSPIDRWGRLMTTATWEGRYDTADASALFARIRNTEVALP